MRILTSLTQTTDPQSRYLAIMHGFIAMLLFSLTVPVTRLALVHFDAGFIAASRAFGAGSLALFVIYCNRWRLPVASEWLWLGIAGLGIVVAFPFLLAKSLESLSAVDMGIILAGLPLMTALMATVILNERHRPLFWVSAIAGALVLATYYQQHVGSNLANGNAKMYLLALLTLGFGGLGYAGGAKAAKTLGAWPAVCWILVGYLPLSCIAFIYHAWQATVTGSLTFSLSAWLPVIYLTVISQWFGFKYWYHAMTVAGAGTIGQLQLIQPFFTLGFSAVLLLEPVTLLQCIYGVIIMLIVALGLSSRQ